MSIKYGKIRFRKDRGTWELFMRVDGKRKRLSFATEEEATSFMSPKEDRALEPEQEAQESGSIVDCVKAYYRDVSSSKCKITHQNEKTYLNLTAHFLVVERGLSHISDVKYGDVLALQKWVSSPMKYKKKVYRWNPPTVNRAFNCIKDFFVHWVREGLIEASPCQHLRQLSHDNNSRRPMAVDEFRAALEKCPAWFKPAFKFMHLTGSDPSSLSRLKWSHVNFTNGVLTLKRKKGAGWRDVPLPLTGELERLMLSLAHKRKSEAVFLNQHGKPLSPGWCSKVGNRAIRDAGLCGVVLYSLRHGLASDLIDSGASLEVARRLLGHASVKTTQRYTKPNMKTLSGALKLVRDELVAKKCHQDATREKETTSRWRQEMV